MKVVFLDVDGVIVPWDCFDETCLQNLKAIIDRTGAVIVLTSTWRLARATRSILVDELEARNIAAPYDDVPDFGQTSSARVQEILAWLAEHPEVTNWVVLDDEDLAAVDETGEIADRFVRTESLQGLNRPELVERAVSILVS